MNFSHKCKGVDRLRVRFTGHIAKGIRGHKKDTIYPGDEWQVVPKAGAYTR